MFRREYRIDRPAGLSLREGADIIAGMVSRVAAEARALDARSATLAWQVITALAHLFGGDQAKPPTRDDYLAAHGVAHDPAGPENAAQKAKREREHAIRAAKRFDDFIEAAKPKP